MPIILPEILRLAVGPQTVRWSKAQTILYALGIGYGADPTDCNALCFVYEDGLVASPTMCSVMAMEVTPDRNAMGIDLRRLVHGYQRIDLHRQLPVAGEFMARACVRAVFDKGPGRGALIVLEQELTDPAGVSIATITWGLFARADGGFGGSNEGAPVPHPMPTRMPDLMEDAPTRPEQALIYRLNGDLNPLHIDPRVAKNAGFPRPILHGACTYGIASRTILERTNIGPENVASFEARFVAPVYPGETLRIEMWREIANIAFRVRAMERDVTVMNNGLLRCRV
jgi:acyl dehydratase